MTRGDWLTSLARRHVPRRHFELVVSPAIADLQFEPPSARGYQASGSPAGAPCGGTSEADLRTPWRRCRHARRPGVHAGVLLHLPADLDERPDHQRPDRNRRARPRVDAAAFGSRC